MKKYISVLFLVGLFAAGCSEQMSVNSPANYVNTEQPNWVKLPQPEGMNVNTKYSTSKYVYGSFGGTISEYESYYGGPFGRVTIDVNVYFPSNSFYGSKYITMIVDEQTCTTTFSPHMVFNKKVIYNAKFTGVNLTGINPSNIKFAYLADDGSVQYAEHEGITVNLFTGTLIVKNAKIPHFSRYGFVN